MSEGVNELRHKREQAQHMDQHKGAEDEDDRWKHER
jgi:hypothetical protein